MIFLKWSCKRILFYNIILPEAYVIFPEVELKPKEYQTFQSSDELILP